MVEDGEFWGSKVDFTGLIRMDRGGVSWFHGLHIHDPQTDGHVDHQQTMGMNLSIFLGGPRTAICILLTDFCLRMKRPVPSRTSIPFASMISGWWFGTWILCLPKIGNNNPNWRTPSFFGGVGISPNRAKFYQAVSASFSIKSMFIQLEALIRPSNFPNGPSGND